MESQALEIHPEVVQTRLIQDMQAIRAAALQAVDPDAAIRLWMVKEEAGLRIGSTFWDLATEDGQKRVERIFLVAVGKAAPAMAQAAADILGDRLSAGIVVTRYGHSPGYRLPGVVKIIEAGHPVPDKNGLAGALEIVNLLAGATANDRVLLLLSGGASALTPFPISPITLGDLQQITTLLLRSGATIGELNAIRKHLDGIKGGQLVRLAAPAPLVSLILSDVVGDPLDVIASGPTAPDASTFSQAWSILEKYTLLDQTPETILMHLRLGLAGKIAETPKPGEALFDQASNFIIGSNRMAAQAAMAEAVHLGYHGMLLSTFLEGEAREVGKVIAALVKSITYNGDPISAPACLVLGGETTVTVTDSGQGGRNQELALATAIGIVGIPDVMVMCLATDGSDGPTDAAGAIVNGETVDKISRSGMTAEAALKSHNSYPALQAAGNLMILGPTGTNVNDLVVLLAR